MEEKRGKDQRQGNPDNAPDGSILESNFVRFAVKDAQVDGQHREDEQTEADPRQCRSREQMHLRLKIPFGLSLSLVQASAKVFLTVI
jgi:hypothetical protein